MKNFRCKLFGHAKSGHITGFRNMDGSIITYCKRCGVPMVDELYRASNYILGCINEEQNNRLGLDNRINDNIKQKVSKNTGL